MKREKDEKHLGRGQVKAALIIICFLILAAFTAVIVYSTSTKTNTRPSTGSAVTAEPVRPLRRIVTYIVRPGDTFAGIMEKLGLNAVLAHASYSSLKPEGLNALFPGDSIRLGFSPEGKIDSLSLLNRMQNWYHVTFDKEVPAARRVPVITIRTRHLVRGELTRSLSEDMNALGVGDAVTAAFADVFAWDINFFTDPRKGDRFEVVYEMLHAEGKFTGYGDILAATYTASGKLFYAFALPDTEGGTRVSYFGIDGKALQKQFLKAPLRFSRISSRFTMHRRHPVLGIVRPHLGVDYAAPMGTPVCASADGIVASAGTDGGFGRVVRINHGGSYQTTYGHLSGFAKGIRSGTHVKQGDVIGYVGSSGLSTGPHLDYRMRAGGRFVNPQTVSLPSKPGVDMKDLPRFRAVRDSMCAVLQNEHAGMNGCWELTDNKNKAVSNEPLIPILKSAKK